MRDLEKKKKRMIFSSAPVHNKGNAATLQRLHSEQM